MATALSLLSGFNNATIQALTSDQLQAAIDLVRPEVAKAPYGSLYEPQVADLAAHDLLMEAAAAASSGAASGQVQTLKRKKVGPREEEYGSSSSSSSSDGRSEEDLGRSFYGQRFLRRKSSTIVGIITS
jgi:hypothetical protein